MKSFALKVRNAHASAGVSLNTHNYSPSATLILEVLYVWGFFFFLGFFVV